MLPQTWHLQLNLHDFSCGKDISNNAVSKVLQIFQEEARITNATAKQALDLVAYVMFVLTVSISNFTLESIYKKCTWYFLFQIQDFYISVIFKNKKKHQQMKNESSSPIPDKKS